MSYFFEFKKYGLFLLLSMIGIYCLFLFLFHMGNKYTMKLKTNYLKSIGFNRVIHRRSMFGNYDSYKWERNDEFITERSLEKTSLTRLKNLYDMLEDSSND